MPEESQSTPIQLVQHVVFVMEQTWPSLTTFTPEFLQSPHTRSATYDEQAGTVTFDIFNGGAVYSLSPAEIAPNGAPLPRLGTLVEDSVKKTARRP